MRYSIHTLLRSALLLAGAAVLLTAAGSCRSLEGGGGKANGPSPASSQETSGEQESARPENGREGSAPEGNTEDKKKEGDGKKNEEEQRFVYAVSPPELNLDPIHTFTSTEAQVYTALYEGLVGYNPFTLEPMPAAAANWDVSEDGTVYTFNLRKQAVYSNGDPIKAQHFRETWLELIDPEDKAEYASLLDVVKGAREYRTGVLDDPEEVGITAVDEHTLKVELRHPASHFLKILCHHSFAPVHPSLLENPDWSEPTEIPVNGPFYIAEEREDALVLRKNDLYWDSAMVELDTLVIRYVEDPQKAAAAFNEGKIDWADTGIAYDAIKNRDAMVVNPLFSTFYYFFSAERGPFDDPQVRRGLALLLPWNEIRSEEYMYIPSSSLVPEIGDYPQVDGISEQDAEQGLKLLEEAGYPQGRGLPDLELAIPEGEETRRIAELMKSSWEEQLEVSAEVEGYPFDTYYDELKGSDFTVGTLTWIGDFADPLTFLQMWTGDSSLNMSGYSSGDYDAAIEEALAEENSEKRLELLSEAEKMLLRDAAVLPIKHSPAFNVIDLESVEGWFPNPLDIHPFKYVRFSVPSLPQGVVERRLPAPPVELAHLP